MCQTTGLQVLPTMFRTQLSLVSCWQPPLRGQNSAKQLEASACTGTKNACTPLPGCIELAEVSGYLFAVAAKHVSHSAEPGELLAAAVTSAELSNTAGSERPHRHQECVHTPARVHRAC